MFSDFAVITYYYYFENLFQLNTPLSEVIENRRTLQPFLVAQGSNKGAVSQFNIVFDGKCVPCAPLCSSTTAIASLFKCHYVFNITYDPCLKPFWEFIQSYYYVIDTDNVRYTPKMAELRSRLLNWKS